MHFAAAVAGAAAASASTGLCCSLANALGAAFAMPAGLASAVMLPRVVQFNAGEGSAPGARMAVDPRYPVPRARLAYAALAEALGTAVDTAAGQKEEGGDGEPAVAAAEQQLLGLSQEEASSGAVAVVVPTDDDGAPEVAEAPPPGAAAGGSSGADEASLLDSREQQSADSLVRALADMAAALGVPPTLSEALGPGFEGEFLYKVDAVAAAAFADQSTRTNPRAPLVEARRSTPRCVD